MTIALVVDMDVKQQNKQANFIMCFGCSKEPSH